MRSVHTAFNDFAESFNSPTRVILLVLFLLSGVSAPLVKVFVTTLLRGASARDDDEADSENTRLVILPPTQHTNQSAWSRVRKRLRRQPSSVRIEEVDSDDDFHESGAEPPGAAGWGPLGFMQSTRNVLHAKHL